jgi:flotillin
VAEQELQGIRSQVEQLRLVADQVLPAEADRSAAELRARGDSAILRERGHATSVALKAISAAWSDAGSDALAIFLIEDLERLLTAAGEGVAKMRPETVNVIDSGDGSALVAYFDAYPAMLHSMLDSVRAVTGIDIPREIGGTAR